MDKRRVTRIPSIFDSDDDEDEISQDRNFNKEDVPHLASATSPANQIGADEAGGSKSVAENDDEDNVDRKMCKNNENEGTGKSVDEDKHSDKEDSIGEIHSSSLVDEDKHSDKEDSIGEIHSSSLVDEDKHSDKEDSIGEIHSSSLEEVVDDDDVTDDDDGHGSVKNDGNDVAEGNGDVRDDDIINNEDITNKDEDVNESKEDVNESKEDVNESKEDVNESKEDVHEDEDDEDIADEDEDVNEDDEDIAHEDEDVMSDVEEVINGGEYLVANDANAGEGVQDNVVNNGEETVNNKDTAYGEELNDGENSDDDMNEEEIDEMEEEEDDMNEEDIDEMNEEDVGEVNEEDDDMNEEDDEVNEEDVDELHEEDVDEMNSEDDMEDIEDVNKEIEKNIEDDMNKEEEDIEDMNKEEEEEEDEMNKEEEEDDIEEAEAMADKSHDIGDDGDKVDEVGTMEVSDEDNEDDSEDDNVMDVDESLEDADGDQDVEEEEEEVEGEEGVEDDIEGDEDIAHESEENENSFEEEGNEGYVVDLNDSGNEADISKVEEREEEVLDSSSSTENELKINTEVNVGELVKGLERTGEAIEKDKDDVSKGSTTFKLSESFKETEVEPCKEKEVQQTEKKEVYQNKEPEATSSKIKIPILRVPVRVEDIFTDSEVEDEATKEPQKDENIKEVDCVSESTASVDPEDQKENLSASSRAGSIEPLASSPIVSPQKDKPAKIWVSKSIFEKKGSKPMFENKEPKPVLEKKEPKLTVEKRRPKKVKGGLLFDQEKCLKALNEGWCREMVHRSTVDTTTPNRIRADIYYYSPSGKKLRSRVEIEQYLIKNNITSLTMANFSFAKQAIGGNEKQEIIRHATKTLGGTPRRKWQSTDTTDNDTPTSTPPLGHKKRGRPKKFSPEPIYKRVKTSKVLTPPQVVAKVASRVVTQRVARDPSKVMTQQFTKDASKETPQRDAGEPSKVMTYKKAVPAMTSIPVPIAPPRSIPAIIRSPRWKTDYSVTKTVTSSQSTSTMPVTSRPKYNDIRNHVVFTTRLCDTVGIQTRILTPMLSENARQQTFHCTGLCPQGHGLVPSLQCVKCLCLFHPKCTKMPAASLEIIQSGEAKFLCPNCYKENKVKAVFKRFKPPTPFEPLVQDPASSSSASDDDDEITVIEPVDFPSSYVRVNVSEPATLPTPPSSPLNQSAEDPKEGQSQSSAIMSSHVRHSTGMSGASSTGGQGLSANLPTDNITLPIGTNSANLSSSNSLVGLTPGGQLLQIQAPGVGAPPRYILVRPQNNNLQNCTQVGPARAVYIPSAGPQIPIVLSNGGSTPQQQVFTAAPPVRLPSGGTAPPQLYSSSGYPFPQHTLIPSTGFQSSTTPEKQKTPPMSRPKTPVIQKKDFLQELSQSYRLLLRVFKYLTAKDLLITSRVCLMWRDLSYSSSLWNSLRLRNICVRDWNMLALFLERRNTKSIDLRKMVFRVKQSSPEPEEASRIDSPEPDSSEKDSVTSHPNDITPPSTSENSLQKASPEDSPQKSSLENSPQKSSSSSEGTQQKESSPEKSKDSEVKTTEVTDVDDEKVKDVKEAFRDHSNEDSSLVVHQESSNVEELTASEDKTLDKSIEEQEATVEGKDAAPNQNTKDNTQDTVKMSSEDVCRDAKDSSDTEDEPMEIDEDAPNAATEDKSVNDRKEEENMEVVKEDKPLEELKEKEHKDKEEASKNDNSGDSTGEQITKRRESSVGNLSNSDVDAASKEDNASSKNKVIETWQHICEALGTVRCLRSVVLPPCTPEILQLLLSNCKNITSLTAADIGSTSDVNFDPAYLMEAPKLKEIRIGSTQGLSLTTNFNFIKLQDLKVLVLRGFAGKSWPYLGTNLTSLHLGPCHSFTPLTWKNIGSMKNLRALWLEDGGSVKDILIFEAISQLTQLRRLCLFNFTIGPKLGLSLKKLTRLERIFVLQGSSDGVSMGIKNNNMLAVTEHLRFLDELVWAVSSQHVTLISGVDHMLIFSPKLKSYPSLSATENSSDQWPLKLIETVVKRHLPMTRVRIMKLDPAAAARMALSTL